LIREERIGSLLFSLQATQERDEELSSRRDKSPSLSRSLVKTLKKSKEGSLFLASVLPAYRPTVKGITDRKDPTMNGERECK
jgi:hypothetical protein